MASGSRPSVTGWEAPALVPGAKITVIPAAAHMTTWDNPQAMLTAVRDHLRSADSTVVKP